MKSSVLNLLLYPFVLISLTSCTDFKAAENPTNPGSNSSYTITEPVTQSYLNSVSQVVSGSCDAGVALSLTGDISGSPISVTCSGLGNYTQSVVFTGSDGAKNLHLALQNPISGSTTESVIVHIDRAAPAAVIVTSPTTGSSVNQTAQTIQGTCESGSTVSLTGSLTTSPLTTTCANGTFSRAVTLTSAAGSKSISLTQRDRAGNVSNAATLNLTLTVATVPAAITFTSPANNSWVNSLSQTITGTCVTGNTVTLNPGATTGTCASNAFSIAYNLTTPDGVKTVTGSQTNSAGTSPNQTLTLNLDRATPSAPTVTSHTTGATVSNASVTLAGACETNATVSFVGAGLTATVNHACVGGNYSQAVTLASGNGSKAFNIRQTDRANNTSANLAFALNLNTTAPAAPTITSHTAGMYTNTQGQTVTGACVNGNTVSVTGNLVLTPRTGTCANNAYSIVVSLSAGTGQRTITVTQTNGSLTSAETSVMVNLDTNAPTSAPTVTSHTSGATVTEVLQTFTGVCENQATVIISGDITQSPSTTTCSSANYSRLVTLTSGNGTKNITITQRDLAGNLSPERNMTLTLNIAAPNNNWGPVNSTRVFLSGHSLMDNPLPDYLASVAASASDNHQWNQQNVIGSPIHIRSGGGSVTNPNWSGYRTGKNKSGDGMNVINEIRNPQTIGAGQRYDTLVITENHSSLGQIQWSDTARFLRHYHDLMISGNSATRTFLYHSWLDINKSNPTLWIQHEKNSEVTWECVVSKVNQSLQTVGRADRLRLLPAGGALVYLVEQVLAGNVSGISGTTQDRMDVIFRDNVHMTQLGAYYLSLVVYASTYGKSPSGTSPASGSGVSVTIANQLQNIAWTYVNAYYNQSSNPAERSMSSCRSFVASNSCHTYYTLMNETHHISGCSNFYGSSTDSDNPFRNTAFTPFAPAW